VKVIDSICVPLGLDAPAEWAAYFDLAKSWGARTDLTSARDEVTLAEILFVDAAQLLAAGWLRGSPRSMVDVGAGVGAPSIPLALGIESTKLVLAEPRRRRAAFLRTAIGTLGLADRARVIEERIDEKEPQIAEAPFDVALSRATFAPARWLPIGLRLASEVWVLTAGDEPGSLPTERAIRRLDYALPSTGSARAILAFEAEV